MGLGFDAVHFAGLDDGADGGGTFANMPSGNVGTAA
jgi:hypothetical protein